MLVCGQFDETAQLPQQRELFRLSFPENVGSPQETEAHYRWKFRAFPSSPPAYEYGAEEGGELVGYYAALPYRYKFFGEIKKCGMVCDVMTHPKMRGKGVFAALGRHATCALKDSGLAFTTGYPIRPEVIPGHLKVGWRIVFRLPIYIRLLQANSLLSSRGLQLLKPVANAGLATAGALCRALAPRTRLRVAVEPGDELWMSEAYAIFLDRWLSSTRIGLVKDAAFMGWRLRAPGTNYSVIVARNDESEVIALAVVRQTVLRGISCLAILDFMAIPGMDAAFGVVVPAMRELAARHGAEAIVTMMSRTWARRYQLSRAGFWKSPAFFSLIVKPLEPEIDAPATLDEANWHLMWIDSDDL